VTIQYYIYKLKILTLLKGLLLIFNHLTLKKLSFEFNLLAKLFTLYPRKLLYQLTLLINLLIRLMIRDLVVNHF